MPAPMGDDPDANVARTASQATDVAAAVGATTARSAINGTANATSARTG